MDTKLQLTVDKVVDKEPPRVLIDLQLRAESMRRHDIARRVVAVLCGALGVLVLVVLAALGWLQ